MDASRRRATRQLPRGQTASSNVGETLPLSRTELWLLRLPYALRNVVRRWRDLIGMMLGVGIALGIGTTLLGVSNATLAIFTADFQRSGADLYVLSQGGTLIPVLVSDTTGTISQAHHVVTQIRSWPDVEAAVGGVTWPLLREREGPRTNAPAEIMLVMGMDGDPREIPGMLVMEGGRWLQSSSEIVVGDKLARDKQLVLGDSIRLAGRDFTIVGIGKVRGLNFSANALVYMDFRTLQQRAGAGDQLNVIGVRTNNISDVRQRVAELGELSTFDRPDLVRLAQNANDAAVAIYWVLIILTLSIAALFVSTMLSHSVMERRMEFAVLRAIGIPTRTILLTVVIEATLVSVVAGVFGSVFAMLLGYLLNVTIAQPYGYEELYVGSAEIYLLVFALALTLGLASALLPARRATRIDPIETLREA